MAALTTQADVQIKNPEKARTVVGAKAVELAFVTYVDDHGNTMSQLAVVGDKTLHLLDNRTVGMGSERTPSGRATEWLREGVFKALGKKVKK